MPKDGQLGYGITKVGEDTIHKDQKLWEDHTGSLSRPLSRENEWRFLR